MEQLEADVGSLIVSESAPSWKRQVKKGKGARTGLAPSRWRPGRNTLRARTELSLTESAMAEKRAAAERKRTAPFGHFFDLPIELREQIYKLALEVDPSFEDNHAPQPDGRMTVWLDCRRNEHLVDSLVYKKPRFLTVSRQTRAEAGALYYRTTRFLFDELTVCTNWLLSLDKDFQEAIRHLCYCTGNIRCCIADQEHEDAIPTKRQADFIEQDWMTLQKHFMKLGVDTSKGLQVCGNDKLHYGGDQEVEQCTWTTQKDD